MKAKKTLILVAAVALVAAIAIGGTLAYLTAKTDPVVNTFTVGKIALTLNESPLKTDGTLDTEATPVLENSYKLVPGNSYNKDPKVTVTAKSEACYVFIKVTETNKVAQAAGTGTVAVNYFDYEIATDWTPYTADGVTGVYYKTFDYNDDDQTVKILKNDEFTVSGNVTETMMEAIAETGASLSFQAAAVQSANMELAAAYAEVADFFAPATPEATGGDTTPAD